MEKKPRSLEILAHPSARNASTTTMANEKEAPSKSGFSVTQLHYVQSFDL